MEDWRAIRFTGPCGRWYLVHDEKDRVRFAVKDGSGKLRIVMSRDELLAIERGLDKHPSEDDRAIIAKQFMGDLINVKSEFPNAKLVRLGKDERTN